MLRSVTASKVIGGGGGRGVALTTREAAPWFVRVRVRVRGEG